MKKAVLSLSLISSYLLAGSAGAEYTIAEGKKTKIGGGIQGKDKTY